MEASEYREHWLHRKVWTRLKKPQHQARLRRCADECVGESFIDVGCACGHSTSIMSNFHPGKWTGVDFDKEIIKNAKDFFPGMTFYALSGISQLQALGKFDSVVCSEVIEHIPDDRAFILQLWAIAGKKLIVTTPNRFVDDPGHLRVYGMKKLQRIFCIEHLGADAVCNIRSVGRFWHITVDRRTS